MAEPLTEQTQSTVNPIIDDPDTLRELYNAGLPVPEPEDDDKDSRASRAWEEPLGKVAESQEKLAALVTELAQNIQNQPRGGERVVERVPYERPAPEPEPEWRQNLKPEQAKLLESAIEDRASRKLQDFKEKELFPTLQYITSIQERLLEAELAKKYDDEDFGYGNLAAETKAYRQASGFNIDLETAYSRVAFDKMAGALKGARQLDSQRAKREKAQAGVEAGGTTPERGEEDDEYSPQERQAAVAFFSGADPRTGKLRTPQEIQTLWMENKKGAKRDELPD